MENKKKINLKLIKLQQFSKYSSYDIPINILEDTFEKVVNIPDELELILKFNKLMGEYIVNNIKNDNIDIQIILIDNYSYIKKLIVKNPKYNLPNEEINKIYEDAIELLKIKYDKNELLSTNILNNMRYIILKDKKEIFYEEKYDISFLYKYIKLYEIDIKEYASILGYKINKFNEMMENNTKLDKNDIYLLCIMFNVNNYEELKSIINEKIEFFIKKEHMINEKKKKHHKNKKIRKEVIDQKVNIGFMKEYVLLYNYDKHKLSRLMQCGISTIEKLLNNEMSIKESLLFDTYEEFKVNNYKELKEKIIYLIQLKKEQIKLKEEENKRKEERKKIIKIESLGDQVFEILDIKNMNNKDCLITMLLFTNIKNLSVDEISDILQLNKSYVLKIYINDLEKIKSHLLKDDNTLKLIHKNEEVD